MSIFCGKKVEVRPTGVRTVSVYDRYDRTVDVLASGVRIVTISHQGEWWTRYVIAPRSVVLQELREARERGWNRPEAIELLPGLDSEYYGGPGRSFVRHPHRLQSSRRFVVAYQSGGLDV